jgi:di/tricarboxylate transporter
MFSLIAVIVGVILTFSIGSWLFKDVKRLAVAVLIVFVIIVAGRVADAPMTVASGNPFASVLRMLPADADTSTVSTKVNGVGVADALKDGGISKAIGADGFGL